MSNTITPNEITLILIAIRTRILRTGTSHKLAQAEQLLAKMQEAGVEASAALLDPFLAVILISLNDLAMAKSNIASAPRSFKPRLEAEVKTLEALYFALDTH